ncbi:ATP-binding protein [Acidithiobacillus sp.]|uniref:sensor histidine kinase n=1 Tax=Acidithiobacillus sp. TaxID=1872118 RepID=UPI0025B8E509|nr:ATP-binding protein [Acidithiobacillus sp.]
MSRELVELPGIDQPSEASAVSSAPRPAGTRIFRSWPYLWQRLSWRSKSMAFVLLLVALVYALIAVFLYTSVRADLTSQVQNELARLTENIARDAANPILLKDGGKLAQLAHPGNPLVRSVEIVDRSGVVVASTQLSQLGEPARLPPRSVSQADLFRAAIAAGSYDLGTVWLQGNRQKINALVDERLNRTTSRLLILGAITALLGLLGAYLVSLAITRPVLRLLHDIEGMEQRLGLEDRRDPQAPDRHGDELHRLERAFRMTEVRLHEHLQELQRLHQRQQDMQCMATIGEMSSQVAHEIRNALSSLRGAARYLVRYGGQDAGKGNLVPEDFLSIIEEEVQRLYDMTQGFLDFGRSYRPEYVDTALCTLLQRCVERHRPDFEGHGVEVELDCPGDLHAIVDPSLIAQALSNLLLNAIDAVPQPGGRIALRARPETPGMVCIAVRDNGPGVPADKRSAIFKPYVTTKTKGSGLGLAMVAKIMMVHEGRVELKDADQGAEFVLHIPDRLSSDAV